MSLSMQLHWSCSCIGHASAADKTLKARDIRRTQEVRAIMASYRSSISFDYKFLYEKKLLAHIASILGYPAYITGEALKLSIDCDSRASATSSGARSHLLPGAADHATPLGSRGEPPAGEPHVHVIIQLDSLDFTQPLQGLHLTGEVSCHLGLSVRWRLVPVRQRLCDRVRDFLCNEGIIYSSRNNKPRMCPHASLWPPEAAGHGGRPTRRRFDSSQREAPSSRLSRRFFSTWFLLIHSPV